MFFHIYLSRSICPTLTQNLTALPSFPKVAQGSQELTLKGSLYSCRLRFWLLDSSLGWLPLTTSLWDCGSDTSPKPVSCSVHWKVELGDLLGSLSSSGHLWFFKGGRKYISIKKWDIPALHTFFLGQCRKMLPVDACLSHAGLTKGQTSESQ